MDAESPKPWWQSRTIWFSLVTALCTMLAVMGHHISPDQVNQITDFLMAAAGVISTGLTIYYRIKADTMIGKANPASPNQDESTKTSQPATPQTRS